MKDISKYCVIRAWDRAQNFWEFEHIVICLNRFAKLPVHQTAFLKTFFLQQFLLLYTALQINMFFFLVL